MADPQPRQRPVVECLVYDAETEGTILYPAFGGRHRVYELSKRDSALADDKSLKVNYVSAEVIGQAGAEGGLYVNGQNLYQAVKFVPDPVAAAMAYPLPDHTQCIDLNYFEKIGYFQDYWWDGQGGVRSLSAEYTLPDGTVTGPSYIYNAYGNSPEDELQDVGWKGLKSKFQYPPNPIICLELTRVAPPPKFINSFTPQTLVAFGMAAHCQYVLQIPYDYPPSLWMMHKDFTAGGWMRIQAESGGSELSFGSTSWFGDTPASRSGDIKRLWIGSMGGGIAVSQDGFHSLQFFPLRFKAPTVDAPMGQSPTIPGSPIIVFHNAGQFGLSVVPVKMPPYAVVQGPLERLPFSVVAAMTYTPDGLFINPRGRVVLDNNDAIVGSVDCRITLENSSTPAEGSRIPEDLTGFEWRATMNSVQFTSSFLGSGNSTAAPSTAGLQFKTCVSPFLHDVIYGHPAVMVS